MFSFVPALEDLRFFLGKAGPHRENRFWADLAFQNSRVLERRSSVVDPVSGTRPAVNFHEMSAGMMTAVERGLSRSLAPHLRQPRAGPVIRLMYATFVQGRKTTCFCMAWDIAAVRQGIKRGRGFDQRHGCFRIHGSNTGMSKLAVLQELMGISVRSGTEARTVR
jgi:hypothetical protein